MDSKKVFDWVTVFFFYYFYFLNFILESNKKTVTNIYILLSALTGTVLITSYINLVFMTTYEVGTGEETEAQKDQVNFPIHIPKKQF